MEPNEIPTFTKPKAGFKRWCSAWCYSLSALKHGWKEEHAIREEILLIAVGAPLALFLAPSFSLALVMIAALLLILMVEAINTAIERTLDRVSTEIHPQTKIAKDMGSLAVLLAIIIAACIWISILL